MNPSRLAKGLQRAAGAAKAMNTSTMAAALTGLSEQKVIAVKKSALIVSWLIVSPDFVRASVNAATTSAVIARIAFRMAETSSCMMRLLMYSKVMFCREGILIFRVDRSTLLDN